MNFYLPTRMICQRGAVQKNAALLAGFGKRCLIVTGGSSARRCGALDDACAALDEQGVAWTVWDRVEPNPSILSCIEGGRLAHAFGAAFILGIGGGSPMDAAKAVAISAANPALDAPELYSYRWPSPPLPVVLIGTTAGTGSEVTPVAVITDTDGRKHSFRCDEIYAALAFGDPGYTETMPPAVTASTGVDALAHCAESWLALNANSWSRAAAAGGIRLLLPPLQALAGGGLPGPEQREALYEGSILGGTAISVTGTLLPHNLGYYLTERYGIPHGFACAEFLPDLFALTKQRDPARWAEFEAQTGTSLPALTELIRTLCPKPKLRMDDEEIGAILPRWENSAALRKTPGSLGLAEIRTIWETHFGA